jgi:hypothetical protein
MRRSPRQNAGEFCSPEEGISFHPATRGHSNEFRESLPARSFRRGPDVRTKRKPYARNGHRSRTASVSIADRLPSPDCFHRPGIINSRMADPPGHPCASGAIRMNLRVTARTAATPHLGAPGSQASFSMVHDSSCHAFSPTPLPRENMIFLVLLVASGCFLCFLCFWLFLFVS